LPLFANLALLACIASGVAFLLPPPQSPGAIWATALFPLLALAATLLALARTLPAQNVLAVAVIIALLSGIVEIINVKTGVPFGARTFTDDLGPQILGLPWPLPFLSTAALLSSRGVARLILRPWRKTAKYGLWVIGLAALLTVIFDFNLEPFASAANSWWIWRMPKSVPAWQTAPWVNFLGLAMTTLLILAFTTPWLINKSRTRSGPLDYHPLLLWLLLNLLPAAGDATHHLWLPAALAVVLSILATTFALRGARW
ncbi:MAG TPA: carotenoid biosynthesis protein, partial [Verrucomicrobiae bacterium]|nr:carotenoid biosynthesis protein [Verrucomicrobiae bacterium]